MLVTQQIPALFNGVSQQPPAVRSPSQWEFQSNATSSVVDGIRKRSPVEHIATIPGGDVFTSFVHAINRDINERYIVLVEPTGIRVFDMEGNEKTVTAPLGWDYLALPTGGEGRFVYQCVTVADYTFVVNKSVTVEMGEVGDDLNPPDDDYWWLNRVISDSPSAALSAARAFDHGFQYRPDEYIGGGGAFRGGGTTTPTVNTNTGITPNVTGSFKGSVQTLQDLDSVTPAEGDVYKIVGTNDSNFQSYYVIRSGNAWNETVKPGIRNLIKAETMPHALVRQGDGTFIFGPFAWSPRRVGDSNTNPNPTFVGRNIRDVFFYKNRLGFCVDENVVLSRSGDFGNFYRLTVVDYLPDEVVDIAASETKVAKMEYALPLQSVMMLFSDQTQFKLSHEEVFTGATVSLTPVTNYPMVPSVPPVQSGSDLYFASQGSGWGQLREYFVNEDNDTHDASNVSAHVPRYIPRDINQIVASPEFNFVGVVSDADPGRIYAYQYYWQSETEKAQSAWNYWDVALTPSERVLGMTVLGGYLYLLVRRRSSGGTLYTTLERMALFYGSGIADLDYQVYLDRRVELTGTWDGEVTTFTLPYAMDQTARPRGRVVLGAEFDDPGRTFTSLDWSVVNDTTITLPGDFSAHPVAFGYTYETRLIFSRQYKRNSQGEATHTGRLQLKTMTVYCTDTAYLRTEVRPNGPGTSTVYTRDYPSRTLSVNGFGDLSGPVFAEGTATIAVQADAATAEISLVNDSHLGFCINSAEWEGFYFNRARA